MNVHKYRAYEKHLEMMKGFPFPSQIEKQFLLWQIEVIRRFVYQF